MDDVVTTGPPSGLFRTVFLNQWQRSFFLKTADDNVPSNSVLLFGSLADFLMECLVEETSE